MYCPLIDIFLIDSRKFILKLQIKSKLKIHKYYFLIIVPTIEVGFKNSKNLPCPELLTSVGHQMRVLK